MLIRAAEPCDLMVILDLMNDAILNSTAIYDYNIRTKAFIEDWFAKKEQDKLPVLVYEIDHTAVAFATYGSFRPREAYQFSVEHSIYVQQVHQGKGIGKKLLEALISEAKAGGFHTMIAGIDATNQASCVFHQKNGFVQVGIFKEVGFKFDRWLDLVFMQFIL
ncbi:MAG: N-acetyltransferase family protein [Chitinophagaceae bacterium]